MLVFLPLSIVSNIAAWDPILVFAFNYCAIIPLVSLISYATQERSFGRLPHAIFCNMAELIVRFESESKPRDFNEKGLTCNRLQSSQLEQGTSSSSVPSSWVLWSIIFYSLAGHVSSWGALFTCGTRGETVYNKSGPMRQQARVFH